MVWYSHLLKNCPQFVVVHTVKGLAQSIKDIQGWMDPTTIHGEESQKAYLGYRKKELLAGNTGKIIQI